MGLWAKSWRLAGRVWRRSRYEVAKRIMPSTAVLGPKVVPRIAGPLTDRADLKLHLGCGPMHLDGYINVDQDPAACADFYLDFRELKTAFRAGAAAEVLMVHSLSYLNLWEARRLFRTVHQLLRPGGKFILELPDLGKCARHLLDTEGDVDAYLEGVRGVYAFDLSQIRDESPITPYAFGWSQWHLCDELKAAGFGDFQVLEPAYHEQPWRDIRVEAARL